MRLFTRQASPTEQLKNAAIEAAISGLRDSRGEPKRKSGLSGGRAVAVGAVLYTAGVAAFKGRRFLLDPLMPIRREFWPDGNFPASTTITVHSLPAVGMMLEISAVAVIGDK